MDRNIFLPKIGASNSDTLSGWFIRVAQAVIIMTFVFLPAFFLPSVAVAVSFLKSMIMVVAVYSVLMLVCFAWLRRGQITFAIPLPIVVFFGFLGVAFVSALLSGDVFDSLYGATLDVYSVGFTLLLAFVMPVMLLLARERSMITRFMIGAGIILFFVFTFVLIRIVGVFDLFKVEPFAGPFITPAGSLNDLALYAGLTLIFIMTIIPRVPKRLLTQVMLFIMVLMSLGLLAIVNFTFVWILVALVGLFSFLYLLARDTWLTSDSLPANPPISRFYMALVGIVCIVAGSFVVSGDYLGTKINQFTQLNYVEVRPSFTATLAIAQAVFRENALLGIGPNRFEDAWRRFKDQSINTTPFWNTNFAGGNSYIFTLVVTTGIAGSVFLLLFLGMLVYYGLRQLWFAQWIDKDWQYLGVTVMAGTGYLWITLLFYTPGASILLLTAGLTGLMLAIIATQQKNPKPVIDVRRNRQQGFILIGGTVTIIILGTVSMIALGRHLSSQMMFVSGVESFKQSGDVPSYDQMLEAVAEMVPQQDVFIAERASLRLNELNRLASIASPTEDNQKQFEEALLEGIKLTKEAIYLDQSNPFNHALLGSFYGLLNPTSLPEAETVRTSAFQSARALDPQNPDYYILEAQIASRFGDTALARTNLATALNLKPDHTEALFLSSQLDIQAGNASSAIAAAEAIIRVEPYNPTRYFQLGLLRLAVGELVPATEALETAVLLDGNYANARYMLALAYLDLERRDEALAQLKIVAQTSKNNQDLLTLITQVEAGDSIRPDIQSSLPVTETNSIQQTAEQTTTTKPPATPLIAPVNRVLPEENREETVSEAVEFD